LRSGGITPCNLNLDNRGGEWSASLRKEIQNRAWEEEAENTREMFMEGQRRMEKTVIK
jgi:hypothetical protein